MRLVGGYNEWAIWVAVVIHIVMWATFLSMMGIFLTALGVAAVS
jgi:hypothetical protein